MPIVCVEGVRYSYPHASVPALYDINLRIAEGSCFGLLGPNGAGKTTLISLLTGLLVCQQGHIQAATFNLPGEVEPIKRLSALVPQDYAFYPALTGRENLKFFAGLYQISGADFAHRLAYCSAACGLDKVLDQRADSYSGGIKRRLNLAIGLLSNPKILYLDEPTVGIDTQSRHFILQAIEGLKSAGMTIVYTSHYMEEVEQICDEIAIIDRGQVLLQEPMSELLKGSRQLVVRPLREPSILVLSTLAQSVSLTWDGVRLTLVPAKGQSLSQILTELERVGVQIEELHMGSNRLEEVYLAATNRELRQ